MSDRLRDTSPAWGLPEPIPMRVRNSKLPRSWASEAEDSLSAADSGLTGPVHPSLAYPFPARFCAAQWVRRRSSSLRDLALHDQTMTLSVLAFEKILSLGEQNCTATSAHLVTMKDGYPAQGKVDIRSRFLSWPLTTQGE